MEWRIDIVILSTETKPTKGMMNGSTLYEVDTGKLYIYYKGTWYEQGAQNTLLSNNSNEKIIEKNTSLSYAPDERSEEIIYENE